MSQIKISCIGSTAVFTNTPDIYSGGNVDEVKFEFDKEWVDCTYKTAVFYMNPKETSVQILDTNNVAKIPSNMLTKKGKLSMGVVGTNSNGDVKASKILTYIVNQGAVTDDMETTAPTPDVWLQILSTYSYIKEIVDEYQPDQLKANKDLSNVSIDDLVNKGMMRILTGSYTGNFEWVTGSVNISGTQDIILGVTPKAVFISEEDNHLDTMLFATTETDNSCEIIEGGFRATGGYRSTRNECWGCNISGDPYYYIVLY